MLQTQIAPDKIRAYKASSYRLEHCSPSIALRIYQQHPALAGLLMDVTDQRREADETVNWSFAVVSYTN